MIFWVLVGVLLGVESAWAWGPATHLYYALSVLEHLSALPSHIQMVLSAQPMAYLYGSVSADIVLAKKFGKAATHCHRWDNAMGLIALAGSDREAAFAWGYLSHLAADTESHNCYVPGKLIETANDKSFLGHMIWELRFDYWVSTPDIQTLFAQLVRENFLDCDALFQRVIETRILNFSFNKKVFDQLLMLQGLERWQGILADLHHKAKQPLVEETVGEYTRRSTLAIRTFLEKGLDSPAAQADPIGESRQRLAAELRRHIKAQGKKRLIDAREALAQDFHKGPLHAIDVSKYSR